MNEKLKVCDLFCGGGGSSTGIAAALGKRLGEMTAIDWDAEVLALHAANHPLAKHIEADVWNVPPIPYLDLLWLSPSYTQHSRARGPRPKDSFTRDLAWVGVRWVQVVRPRVMILENVPEFFKWGPLSEDGISIRTEEGIYFEKFVAELHALGYRTDFRILSACRYGAPTTRERLYLIARRDDRDIVWPAPSHGPGKASIRTAADCIDWSIPCQSIFGRERPLAEKTLRRIAQGIVGFVLNNPKPFIMELNEKERRDGKAPDNITAFLVKYYDGVTGGILDDEIGTITAHDHHSLVACCFKRSFGASRGASLAQPMRTVTAGGMGKTSLTTVTFSKGNENAGRMLRASFLSSYYGTGTGREITKPIPTITVKDRFGVVGVTIDGESFTITDISMRMLQPHELFAAQGFPQNYVIAPLINDKPLSKTAQVRAAGNAVCPPVAKALVEANL